MPALQIATPPKVYTKVNPGWSATVTRLVVFKTDSKHIFGVVKNAKHATDAIPRELRAGDLILLQVTVQSARSTAPQIEHAMTFVRCYEDLTGESDRIWGRHWRYIVEGKDAYRLKNPFDMRRVNKSGSNYGQGAIKFVYVHPLDEEAIRGGGYLEPK